LISKEKWLAASCCIKSLIAARNVNFACDRTSFRYTSLRISSVRVRGFIMFKLAVAAVVAALFAFSPVQAAGAGAGAGAGATEQAKKSSAAKKKVKRKVVRKTAATRTKKAKRQELAAAGDRPRMIRRVKTVLPLPLRSALLPRPSATWLASTTPSIRWRCARTWPT
jgi:hypothetical protein